jgi:hypothetical protein
LLRVPFVGELARGAGGLLQHLDHATRAIALSSRTRPGVPTV